jgi:DnaD/phage-associated family protein
MPFPGFTEDITTQISIPGQIFQQLLYEINDLDELKLTLFVIWRVNRQEGNLQYVRLSELITDPLFSDAADADPDGRRAAIENDLLNAVKRGTLLQTDIAVKDGSDKLICLNSPKGRATIDTVQRGELKIPETDYRPVKTYPENPNIFHLYEANIGPLTPMIADALRDAEKTYQANWIEDAFRIAVERNRRSWHYIQAILQRWQEGGRDDRKDQQNRRDTAEARRRYGEWEK